MRKERLTNTSHPLYKEFEQLYSNSFPIFEQRTPQQQTGAFKYNAYHLELYIDDSTLIGFISYWEFDTTIYIEHFAINSNIRGKGYGSTLLNNFTSHHSKTIVLEIDPIIDDISRARMSFYERCGFLMNSHSHRHPPYRCQYTPHSLIILSTPHLLTVDQYNEFNSNLNNTVMDFNS